MTIARAHAKASRVCQQYDEISNPCVCCDRNIENIQYSMCCDPDDLAHLGITFPMFFTFIKQCAILMIVLILTNSLPHLFINLDKVIFII